METYDELFDGEDDRPEVKLLLRNMKNELPALSKLLADSGEHRGYEDAVYRLYHQSNKVFGLQYFTADIVEALKNLLPDHKLDDWFTLIIGEGTGKEFQMEDNKNWLEVTRPIIEAFFHARYFLEMAVKYADELEYPPRLLPSGWASLLYLYGLR